MQPNNNDRIVKSNRDNKQNLREIKNTNKEESEQKDVYPRLLFVNMEYMCHCLGESRHKCENISSQVIYFMHVQSVWKLKCKTGASSILKYLL